MSLGSASLGSESPARAGSDVPVVLLLVEDDAGDAFLVQEHLADSELPIEIRWVKNLAEARSADVRDVACVLLDLGLPDAVGIRALQEMLQLIPHAAVLVLTGLADEHRGLEAVSSGAQDYLVKGQVDGALLARAIRYAIERKRADESLRRLHETTLRAEENARLERGLLPLPLLTDPTLRTVSRYRPGRAQALLGGDFYDVVETPDGTVYAMIGDVCGHGPDEAALGVSLRIAWRTLVLAGLPEERILPTLDEVLVRERSSEEVFATACMLTISRPRRSGRLFLAGHPVPLRISGDVATLPDEHVGPALGVLPGMSWDATPVDLGDRWSLALYTDGLIEGRVGEGHERLGVDRLVELVRREMARDADPRSWPDALIATVESYNGGPLTDDVAILILSSSTTV